MSTGERERGRQGWGIRGKSIPAVVVTGLVVVVIVVTGLVVVVGTVAVVEETVDDVDVGGVLAQPAWALIVSSIRVTAAVSAYRPPLTVTAELTVIEARARMLPTKLVAVPSVAELPTCQNTLQALAPLMRTTWAAVVVVMVEPIWKTKTLLALFWPSRVRIPVSWAEEAKL